MMSDGYDGVSMKSCFFSDSVWLATLRLKLALTGVNNKFSQEPMRITDAKLKLWRLYIDESCDTIGHQCDFEILSSFTKSLESLISWYVFYGKSTYKPYEGMFY